MVDLILEDASRDDDDFAGVRILLDQIMQEGFAEVRAAMHELAGIIELLEIGDGMPVASNTFPPSEVWS
jgi:hypothetical protein